MTTRAGTRALPVAALAALLVATGMIIGLVVMAGGLQRDDVEQAEVTRVVEAIAAESAAVTNGYFAGPESVADVVQSSLERDLDDADIIALLSNLTTSQDNVDGTFVGYPDGSFLDVRKEFGTVAGLRIKTIDVTATSRRSEVTIVDPDNGTEQNFPLPGDTYDPRGRPWYIGVNDGASEHWTDPYIFFSSSEPGITYSRPILDRNGSTLAVVGVDIRLTDLDSFLHGRRPSENGGAAVLNDRGELIAGSTELLNSTVGVAAIDNLFSTAGDSASPSYRIEGDNPGIIVGTSINDSGTQMMIVNAPDEDFLQDIRTTRQNYALFASMLGGAGVLLLLLGALLIRRHLQRLGWLAETDPLTGLLNRSAVYERALEALTAGKGVAVMAIDLDDFKLVNDQFGHEGGDHALTTVAARIRSSAPTNAVLGRLGGDEFTIVLIDSTDPGRVFRSIIENASGTIESDNYSFELRLSCGYTIADLTEDASLSDLFRRADIALYKAKTTSGTSTVEFDKAMHLRWRRDDERRKELSEAIRNREMQLHFQPEFNLKTSELVGAEGLLRWHHPEHGVVAAAHFIDDLERFSLLTDLQQVLFENAMTLAIAMPQTKAFTIRLNVSADQLADTNLTKYLQRMVAPVNTTWCLEITERTIVEASATVHETLDDLRALGITIALDDFGTGYTSLQELQGLPIDAIKIDHVFVTSLEPGQRRGSIASVLVGLARTLGIDVIAEGVETEQQHMALVDAGCVRGQGFLLGKPLEVHDFINTWADLDLTTGQLATRAS